MEPTTHEFEMMRLLGDIRAEVASTKEILVGLAGPTGRVTALEQSARTASTHLWIHSAIVVPVVTTAHLIAKHFGF
jgi:hypothetical protein